MKKIILISLLLFIAGFALAQPLEVDYPEVSGLKPETIQTPIAIYFKYIFNIIIALLAFVELIIILRGFAIIQSAASPEKVREARKSLWSAVLGIVILLFSWVLLYQINPQLISLRLAGLKNMPAYSLPSPSDPYIAPSDLLKRIRDLAEKIKLTSQEIGDMAQNIKSFTDLCSCSYALSTCLCTGGDKGSQCQPQGCYVGAPCPEWETIQDLQNLIVDSRDVLLYYKNRAFSEWQDLKIDIETSLDVKIRHYENLFLEESNREKPDQDILDFITDQLTELRKEKSYKEAIMEKLADLGPLITTMKEPATQTSQLPDQCPSNVADKCLATCKTGPEYGCHDRPAGCQPDICQPVDPNDPNPCPDEDIKKQVEKTKEPIPQISKISEEIINIIDNI